MDILDLTTWYSGCTVTWHVQINNAAPSMQGARSHESSWVPILHINRGPSVLHLYFAGHMMHLQLPLIICLLNSLFILCSCSSFVALYLLFESGGSSISGKWRGIYGTDATQGIAGDNSTWTCSSHSRACRGCEPPSRARPSIIHAFTVDSMRTCCGSEIDCIFTVSSGGCILSLYSFVSMIWLSFPESLAIQIFFVLILLF